MAFMQELHKSAWPAIRLKNPGKRLLSGIVFIASRQQHLALTSALAAEAASAEQSDYHMNCVRAAIQSTVAPADGGPLKAE